MRIQAITIFLFASLTTFLHAAEDMPLGTLADQPEFEVSYLGYPAVESTNDEFPWYAYAAETLPEVANRRELQGAVATDAYLMQVGGAAAYAPAWKLQNVSGQLLDVQLDGLLRFRWMLTARRAVAADSLPAIATAFVKENWDESVTPLKQADMIQPSSEIRGRGFAHEEAISGFVVTLAPGESLIFTMKAQASEVPAVVLVEDHLSFSFSETQSEEPEEPGQALKERFPLQDYPRFNIEYLLNDPNFPDYPDLSLYVDDFVYDMEKARDLGRRLRVYLVPPVSGVYQFWFAAQRQGELRLGTGESKFSREVIAEYVHGLQTGFGEYIFDRTEEQVSDPIYLEAGRPYFLEAVGHGDWHGHLAVAWKIPGSDERTLLTGEYLKTFELDPDDQDDNDIPDSWENDFGVYGNAAKSDLDGDRLVQLYEYAQNSNPNLADTDSDQLTDLEEYHLGLDPNKVDEYTRDIAPWQLHLPAGAEGMAISLADSTGFIGKDQEKRRDPEDHYPRLQMPIAGDFQFTVQYAFEQWHTLASAILELRAGTADSAPVFAVWASPEKSQWALLRNLEAENPERLFGIQMEPAASSWLRIERHDHLLSAYASIDGESWVELGTQWVDWPSEATLALGVSSADDREFAGVWFDDITIREDADSDGLWNDQEAELGTSSASADSDGDGISDYDEVYVYGTDPAVNNEEDPDSVTSFEEVAVALATDAEGDLRIPGLVTFEDGGFRGASTLSLTVPQSGIYRADIVFEEEANRAHDPVYGIGLWIDDQPLGRKKLDVSETATLSVLLPYLSAGSHEVTVFQDNPKVRRQLHLKSVKLQMPVNSASGNDSLASWARKQVESRNSIKDMPDVSLVSPAQIEGKTPYPHLASVQGLTAKVQGGPDNLWYADIPLNSDSATVGILQLENGSVEKAFSIDWLPLNLAVHTESLEIRQGDSLLLTAFAPGQPQNSAANSIQVSGPLSQVFRVTGADAHPFEFAKPGKYEIIARYPGLEEASYRTVLVNVVPRGNLEIDPVLLYNRQRQVEFPLKAPNLDVAIDSRLRPAPESMTKPGTPKTWKLTLDALYEDRVVITRMPDGGPILDRLALRDLWVFSSAEAYVRYLEQYEDGTYLVANDVVPSKNYQDLEYHFEMFVGGVVFTDGSVYKILNPEDFSDVDLATVSFVKPEKHKASICHRLKIFQHGASIGQIY